MSTKQKKLKTEELISTCENIYAQIAPAMVNAKKSALFVKELMGVAVSTILYYRKIFDDSLFSNRKLDSDIIKILKCNTDLPAARRIQDVVFSAHEAIELGYLRQMILIVEDDKSVIEQHTLTFEYCDKNFKTLILEKFTGATKDKKKFAIDKITKQSKCMIRSIVHMMSTIPKLPEKPNIIMKLTYYDDVTPPDYNPKYFETENAVMNDSLVGKSTKIGEISTPFHYMGLKTKISTAFLEQNTFSVSTTQLGNSLVEETPMETENIPVKKQRKLFNKNKSEFEIVERTSESTLYPQEENNPTDKLSSTNNAEQAKIGGISSPDRPLSAIREEDSEISLKIRCACGGTLDYGLVIVCCICHVAQHLHCYSILEENQAPNDHICELCAEKDPKLQCSSPVLLSMTIEERTKHCLFLFVMGLCYEDEITISVPNLIHFLSISEDCALQIIDRLLDLKIIVKHRKGFMKSKHIYKKIIKQQFDNVLLDKIL